MFAPLLASLALIALTASAQTERPRPPWSAAYSDGVTADDNADYGRAEIRLAEACDIAIEVQDAAGQELVCTKLAQVYAVQGEYKRAEAVLDALVGRLEAIENVHANLVVKARLELANVRSAVASFDGARQAMQGVTPYLPRLRPSDLVEAYVKSALFFLPVDRQASGGDLLRAARRVLEKEPDFDDRRTVRASRRLAQAYQGSGRLQDADAVLGPFVRAARERFARAQPLEPGLHAAYIQAVDEQARILALRGKSGDAERLREEAAAWRKLPRAPSSSTVVASTPPGQVYVAGGDVTYPKLLRKVTPRMTEGARAHRAQGNVVLSVQVWPDGRAHRVTIVRPLPYGLHWEAIGAVRKWRFQPGQKDGEPVKVAAAVEVSFRFVDPTR